MKNIIKLSNYILLLCLLIANFSNFSKANEHSSQPLMLRTGFYLDSFPDLTPEDLEVALRFWSEEVGKQVGITAEVNIYKNVNEMRADFYLGKVDFIVASPLVLVNKFDPKQLADGYKVVWFGTAADSLLVITQKHSKFHDFESVKNTQLSLLQNDPISEMYANVLSLTNMGKLAKQVFKKINYIRKSNLLIYKLFFKKTDVILVYKGAYDLSIELNPQIGAQTQIISSLPNIPRALGFFHSRVDPKFRESVLTEIEKLNTYPRGQQLLALFQADKAVRSNLSDLSTTEKLKKHYLQLVDQAKN